MIPFVKAHACGNDFILVDEAHSNGNHAAVARALCSRHFGVGADGVEFLSRQPNGEHILRLFNHDGSEAELSGNGTRCVAAWLAYDEGLQHSTLITGGGPRTSHILQCDGEHFTVATEMGVPTIAERTIEIDGIGKVEGALIDVGNPHFVLFTNDPDFRVCAKPWEVLGAYICTHPDFPHGTNVEFVNVVDSTHIEFRIYERGVGPTTSSGTGTCASAAATIALRNGARTLQATNLGGTQQVDWPADDQPMLLTGPASIICTGQADEKASPAPTPPASREAK